MKSVIIFGGSGYIGTHLAQYLLDLYPQVRVFIADIANSALIGNNTQSEATERLHYVYCDVRKKIVIDEVSEPPDWIFNLAAVHREPGHAPEEYFDTNIGGAEQVTEYARKIGCRNIYFTSSISVYGPTSGPTVEESPKYPNSPYGCSKYPAELIHQRWLAESGTRRLIIVRPGVVYGPRDPGNIGRMIRAIRRGYFIFPGRVEVYKSYAYIFGLLESIVFTVSSNERFLTYNYVETPTETLGSLAQHVKKLIGTTAPTISLSPKLLMPIAYLVQLAAGNRTPIHPVRVRKASMSTHIIPQRLIDMGFEFNYDFARSLAHWRSLVPEDWR